MSLKRCFGNVSVNKCHISRAVFSRFVWATVSCLSITSANTYANPGHTGAGIVFDPSSVLIVPPSKQGDVVLSAPQGSMVQLDVFSFAEDGSVSEKALQHFSVPATSGRVEVKLKTLPQGYYQVRASIAGSTDISETSLAVIPTPGPVDSRLGVNTHFAQGKGQIPRTLQLIKDSGIGWIRDEIPWGSIEKQRSQFDFPPGYDRYVTATKDLGLSSLLILDYSNELYPDPGKTTSHYGLVSDEQRAAFSRFAHAVALHYKGKVKAWEIWNEPVPIEFGTKDWSGYARVMRSVYPALKSADNNALVVACGGGGGPGSDCIDGILQSGGAHTQDAYSIHPYMAPFNPDRGYQAKDSPVFQWVSVPSVSDHVAHIGRTLRTAAGQAMPGWITEIGWYSAPSDVPHGDLVQAAYLTRTILQAKRSDAVQKLFWYDFQDDGTDPKEKESNFGMIRQDYSPKPAYIAVAVNNKILRGAKWQSAPVDTESTRVFSFERGTTQIWVGWTVNDENITLPLRLPDGQYIETDWRGRQTTVVVANGSMQWNLGAQPRYLVREK